MSTLYSDLTTRKLFERRPKSPVEERIDRAIDHVYHTYGPDLSVFFAAVRRQDPVTLEKHARDNNSPDPGLNNLDRS